MDLVVEGRLFFAGGLTDGCVGIKNGKIVKIAKTLGSQDRLSLPNHIIIPGGMDMHVHFREPGMTHKEDFYTGSKAAAHGGTTFFLDMPNTRPPTKYLSDLMEKRTMAEKSVVDYGLHALLGPVSKPQLAEEATGWKWYYGPSTGAEAWTDIAMAKEVLASFSSFTTLHAEEPSLLDNPGTDLVGHDLARPVDSEAAAIDKIAREGIFGLHVAHCSSAQALYTAKRAGYSAEVTLHHLLLDTGSDLGGYGKVNPPLRKKIDRKALWQTFLDGGSVVASDHAPHTMDEKEQEFQLAPAGMPGVEERLPVLMALAKRGAVPIERVVDACCEKPGRLLGLDKGRLTEGCDADLAAFDPRELKEINEGCVNSKCGWTPYLGQEAIFPSHVVARGKLVVEKGSFVGEKGHGRYVGHADAPSGEGA